MIKLAFIYIHTRKNRAKYVQSAIVDLSADVMKSRSSFRGTL